MRLQAFMAAAAVALFAHKSYAQSADESRYKELGTCMAYVAVINDLDGKRQVEAEAGSALAALGNEFMFEASLLGYDDNQAHTYVVEELVRLNMQSREFGAQAVEAEHGGHCRALMSALKDGDAS